MGITYAQAGVDQIAKDRVIDVILKRMKKTQGPAVIDLPWGFAGLYALGGRNGGARGMREPVLVACADGVGTKLRLAARIGKLDTVGIDLVAMNVNDLIVTGGRPLFFLDYIAAAKVQPAGLLQIMSGILEGCRQAGCALLGGETAEMPGMYAEGDYELAGFAVGIVDRRKLLDGSTVRVGDDLIALPSSGVHSNGFSLVRKIVLEQQSFDLRRRIPEIGGNLAEVLLEPTRIYVRTIETLLRKHKTGTAIRAMAHITGGGMVENLPRVLPEGCAAEIREGTWPVPPIFSFLQRRGGVARNEMYRVFNMGVGMILVTAPPATRAVLQTLRRAGEKPSVIGKITRGAKEVHLLPPSL